MKIFVKSTSERASKAQGGNKFVNIEVLVGDKINPQKLAEITIDFIETKDSTIYQLWNYGNVIDTLEIKNKKQ